MKARIVLGFDFGLKRIGVAAGDTITRTAAPLETVAHHAEPDWPTLLARVKDIGPDLLVVSRSAASSGGRAPDTTVDPALLDVGVVPGLAFTVDGRRLGQGGGHYDRFLVRLRDGCVTVGAAFAEQLVGDLPTEPHDVRLDLVVTDA